MKHLRVISVLAGLLVLPHHGVFADVQMKPQVSDPAVLQYVRTVERGYYRLMGKLKPDGTQYSSDDARNPFSISPFPPRTDGKLSWVITTLDANRSTMCVRAVVESVEEWNSTLSALVESKLQPADATCGPLAHFSLAPNTFPAPIAGIRTLDRRLVPVPTYVPPEIVLDGVDGGAKTNPGVVLCPALGTGYHDIVVSNPALTSGGKPAGGRWGITQLNVSPGFTATHNCTNINRNQLCTVRVAYDPANGDNVAGSLWMYFTTGTHAVTSLLGRTVSDVETGCARATATVPKNVNQTGK